MDKLWNFFNNNNNDNGPGTSTSGVPQISAPYGFQHTSSIAFDNSSDSFIIKDIPEEWVNFMKSKSSKSIKQFSVYEGNADQDESKLIFGENLEVVIKRDGKQIPDLVEKCLRFLEKKGLKEEGLFRISGAQEKIFEYRRKIDSGEKLDLSEENDPHTVAHLLKYFLRELPEPICTFKLYEHFLNLDPDLPNYTYLLRDLILQIPQTNFILLKILISFLTQVTNYSLENKMNISNLAVIFGPTILVPPNVSSIELAKDIPKITKIIIILIHEFPTIFNILNQKEEEKNPPSIRTILQQKTSFSIEKIQRYQKIFEENDITSDLLPDLNQEMLSEMGISSIGDRLQILKLNNSNNNNLNNNNLNNNNNSLSSSQGKLGFTEDRKIEPATIPKLQIKGKIKLIKKIGEGSFGSVFLGNWENSTKVALKKLNLQEMQDFISEVDTLKKLHHPNIINFFGIYSQPDSYDSIQWYIVMEFMEGGSLRDLLLTNTFSLSQRIDFCAQTAIGLNYLHQMNVLHRDLACRNLLVSSQNPPYVIKVSDFGLSKSLYDKEYYVSTSTKFARKWCSPEVLKFQKFSPASDAYTFGVTCWEILKHGEIPYGAFSNKEAVEMICSGEFLKHSEETPEKFSRLLNSLWSPKAEDRPNMKTVLEEIFQIIQEMNPNENKIDNSSGIFRTGEYYE